MVAAADNPPLHGATASAGENHESEGVLASLLASLSNSRVLVGEIFDLATLEAKLAALSMVEIMVFGLSVALLGFTLWLLILAAVATSLILAGLNWPLTLLLLAVVSAIAVWLSIRRIRKLADNLRFTATRGMIARPRSAAETSYADTDPSA